jgi:hypothetical protein
MREGLFMSAPRPMPALVAAFDRLRWSMVALFLAVALQGVPPALAQKSEGSDSPEFTRRAGISLIGDPRPWTRWWWFASVVDSAETVAQLDWLRDRGFGGVEIAFVYPRRGDTAAARQPWLSAEWAQSVVVARRHAARIGLGCDITFGTLWPFGDSMVPEADGARVYGDTASARAMRLTWEHPVRGRVVNHLDRHAVGRYAARVGGALAPALAGAPVSLFCDSWEVETRGLWTPGFDSLFVARYGYDVRPFMDSITAPRHAAVFHDYMSLLARMVVDEFYVPFTEAAHALGATSRAQCGGAPTDLLEAFAAVDVPETETLLFEPTFARIPVSAAVLAGKPVVSSESFTCMYGWKGWPGPGPHQGAERPADVKVVADALFANGVNRIIWHGTPAWRRGDTTRFYASVHAGPGGALERALAPLNTYMRTVAEAMSEGEPYTDVAVVLPLDDGWMKAELPDSLKYPWAWGEYELRYCRFPVALAGRQPMWISLPFLKRAVADAGRLRVGTSLFNFLYMDVEYASFELVQEVLRLAMEGVTVCMEREPREPGTRQSPEYAALLTTLAKLPNVVLHLGDVPRQPPLVEGEVLPPFFARVHGPDLLLFVAHPEVAGLKYPMRPGQANEMSAQHVHLRLRWGPSDSMPIDLPFEPGQSWLLRVRADGAVEQTPFTATF